MLKQNVEIEYKCLVTLDQYQRLLAIFHNDFVTIEQTNTYYCDYQNKINELNAMLRNRVFSTYNTLTFKIWENDNLLEFEIDNTDLSNKELLTLLAKYNIYSPFCKVAEMLTIRRLISLPEAELCLDENHYNDQIDYEIEYELKQSGDYLENFKSILTKADIIYNPNFISKYHRAIKVTD